MRLYLVERDDDGNARCNGCGWRVSNIYLMADSREQAEKLHKELEGGLCSNCICELLMQEGYEIIKPKNKWKEITDIDELKEGMIVKDETGRQGVIIGIMKDRLEVIWKGASYSETVHISYLESYLVEKEEEGGR